MHSVLRQQVEERSEVPQQEEHLQRSPIRIHQRMRAGVEHSLHLADNRRPLASVLPIIPQPHPHRLDLGRRPLGSPPSGLQRRHRRSVPHLRSVLSGKINQRRPRLSGQRPSQHQLLAQQRSQHQHSGRQTIIQHLGPSRTILRLRSVPQNHSQHLVHCQRLNHNLRLALRMWRRLRLPLVLQQQLPRHLGHHHRLPHPLLDLLASSLPLPLPVLPNPSQLGRTS